MTKEELKKEAEKYVNNRPIFGEIGEGYSRRQVEQAYIDSAESREKRIAELEEEKDTMRRKADEAIADKLLITAKYNEILNSLNQEKDNLQKENAELKERISTLEQIKKEHTDYTIKVEEERTYVKEQLTKAKELLKRCYENYIYLEPLRSEIEQFLSEMEK